MDTQTLKSWFTTPVIIIGIIIVALLWCWSAYNGMVRANLGVDTQWAQVESQYQRRFDLIPNLVSSVQGIMKQEKEVFGKLADARAAYSGAQTTDQKAAAAGQVESAFGRLLAIMENYPQLRSVETVQSLMAELSGTENRISVERMRFNESVRDYNTRILTIPGNLFASLFGFKTREMFDAADGSEKAPQVNL